MLPRELIVLRRRQQRLRWNASHIDAGSAERLVHLDAHSVQTELAGADRRNVPARPAANDHDIGRCRRICHFFQWCFDAISYSPPEAVRRAFSSTAHTTSIVA